MKILIFPVLCVFAVCAPAIADNAKTREEKSAEAFKKLSSISWNRKTPIETKWRDYSFRKALSLNPG